MYYKKTDGMDLIGQKFCRLLVQSISHKGPWGRDKNVIHYNCICDCGQEIIVPRQRLFGKIGKKSCGCLRLEIAKNNHKTKYQSGQRINNLILVKPIPASHNPKKTGSKWLIKCDCGIEKEMFSCVLHKVKSCGCQNRKNISGTNSPFFRHGDCIKTLYNYYKLNAKSRKLQFSLTEEEFKELTQLNCWYCGSAPQSRKKNKTLFYNANGIDRQNPEIHYVNSNCVSCCSNCNYAKQDFTIEEFFQICKSVVEHHNLICKD